MCVPRLLILALLISLCAATVAAQSSSERTDSSQPSPAFKPAAPASTDLFQFQFMSDVDAQSLPPAPRMIEGKNDSLVIEPHPLDSRMAHVLTLQQDETTCYTLRTYRVARVSPESDTTRAAGYSTCQPATRFQVRTAVDSQAITPR